MGFQRSQPANTRASTAEEEAYAHILDAIRSGRFARNHRLIPETIAAEIGMSRMPVREAFRRLATEGLVVIRPNRGCVVSGLTIDEIVEVFEIRSVLEGLAVRLAMPRLSEEALTDLELLLHRMELSERSDADRWLQDHSRFHDYICELSGKKKLIAQIRTLHLAIEPYLRMYRQHGQKRRSAAEAHRALFGILRTGEPIAAENAMREHIMGTVPLIAAFLAESGLTDSAPSQAMARDSEA
jgi:DNA-binding GntR family transcriptional regulator